MPQRSNPQRVDLPGHGERRAFARYRPSSVASVTLDQHNAGVIVDVSEGGLRLSAGEILRSEDSIPLSLQLSYRAAPIEATGQIVWISDSKRTAGLQFASLPEKSRARLRDWIASENRGSGGTAVESPWPSGESPGSPTILPDSSEAPLRNNARGGRLRDALLDQEPIIARPTRSEPPHEAAQMLHEQPPCEAAPPPAPSVTPPEASRWGESAEAEGPVKVDKTDPSEPLDSVTLPATGLPSDRILRKQPAPSEPLARPASLRTPPPAQEQPTPKQAEPASPAPATPASRWEPTEPSSTPSPAASDVDSVRHIFQQKQAAETATRRSPLEDDSSTFKFAEWARARQSREPKYFADEVEIEERRPSTLRVVFVSGLMLFCFVVGLIIGVYYLAGPVHPDADNPPATTDNANADGLSANAHMPAKAAAPANPGLGANSTGHSAALSSRPSASETSEAKRNENVTLEPTPRQPPLRQPPPSAQQSTPQQPTQPQPTPPQTARPSSDETLTMAHAVEVTPPAAGSPAVWVRLPQIALSASGSVAISVQQSVLVPPASSLGEARVNQIIVGGRVLASSVQPLVSAVPIDPSGDVVHLRIWIDPQGEIRQIMPGDGRADLIAIAEGEVREWVQTPARIGGRPIDSVEDVTITFRPM